MWATTKRKKINNVNYYLIIILYLFYNKICSKPRQCKNVIAKFKKILT